MENYNNILLFVMMAVVFYLFMIRPQMQQKKKEKKFAAELKRGDRVITKSGLHGKILELNDTTVILESGAGKLKFERSALSLDLSAKLNAPAVVEKKI